MLLLVLLIPWVLTLAALSFIIIRHRKRNIDDNSEDSATESFETIKVAQFEQKAYWVYENVFYEADLMTEPDFSSARPIDTMSMSPKQLNKLLAILDELENYESER